MKINIIMKCKICNKEFKQWSNLSRHINKMHNGTEDYYNLFLKNSNKEGRCKICGDPAKFRNITHGYNNVCEKIECLNLFKGK